MWLLVYAIAALALMHANYYKNRGEDGKVIGCLLCYAGGLILLFQLVGGF